MTEPIPLFTLESRIKRQLRKHLKQIGFTKTRDGLFAPLSESKECLRVLHHAQREEKLKKALMPLILGEGDFQVVPFQGSDYYCATIECWEKSLGARPKVSQN